VPTKNVDGDGAGAGADEDGGNMNSDFASREVGLRSGDDGGYGRCWSASATVAGKCGFAHHDMTMKIQCS
jgi:hypothetical protein